MPSLLVVSCRDQPPLSAVSLPAETAVARSLHICLTRQTPYRQRQRQRPGSDTSDRPPSSPDVPSSLHVLPRVDSAARAFAYSISNSLVIKEPNSLRQYCYIQYIPSFISFYREHRAPPVPQAGLFASLNFVNHQAEESLRLCVMDPMDYILHNPPRLHSHSETMAQGSGSWMSHGHLQPHTSPNHWSSHPPPMQPSFSPPRSHHYHQHHHPFHHLPGTHPFMGHSGGLPLPDPSFRGGFLLPDPVSGLPVHSRHWNQHIQPPMPGPPHAVPLGPMHMNGNPSELSFGYMGAPGGRNQQFVPPAEIGLGPPGATSEPHTLPRPLMPPSAENSANSFGHQLGSQLSAQAPPFASTSQRRGGVHSHSSSYPSSAPRAHRNSLPQSTCKSHLVLSLCHSSQVFPLLC